MTGPGTELGRFRLLGLLGEGGMGTVYVALDPALDRRVALKVLRPELTTRPEMLQRFINEARAVNRIGHENIVEITEVGQAPEGQAYFVMELLRGESLGEHLRRAGRLTLQSALHVVGQVADALTASHAVGIVHRDLKPDNVMLIQRHGDPLYVKLLDFGVAKLVHDVPGQNPRTQSGALLGTARYMSPEQCRGRSAEIDGRSDVYSLGIMLFELLTGRVPFDAEGWGEILIQQVSRPFPSISEVLPGLPAGFAGVLERAVAKGREQRWPTMEAFGKALGAFVEAPARPTPVAALASTVLAAPGQAGGTGRAGGGPRRRWLIVGAAAAAAVVGAGVTLGVLRATPSGRPAVSGTPAPVAPVRVLAPAAVPVPALATGPAPATPPAKPPPAAPLSAAPVVHAFAAPPAPARPSLHRRTPPPGSGPWEQVVTALMAEVQPGAPPVATRPTAPAARPSRPRVAAPPPRWTTESPRLPFERRDGRAMRRFVAARRQGELRLPPRPPGIRRSELPWRSSVR